MKAITFVGVGFAAGAAGLVMFWTLQLDSIFSSPSITTRTTASEPELVESTNDTTEDPVDSDSGDVAPSAAEEAVDSLRTRRQQDMGDALYQIGGTRVVQGLIDSGLAPSDSEEIARRYAADVAECTLATLEVEAARQSISVDELLSRLAATDRNGGDPFDVVDRSSLETNALPCQADAMQRAGIANQTGVQISEEEGEQFQECVESYRYTDIVDRIVILEICADEVFGEVP